MHSNMNGCRLVEYSLLIRTALCVQLLRMVPRSSKGCVGLLQSKANQFGTKAELEEGGTPSLSSPSSCETFPISVTDEPVRVLLCGAAHSAPSTSRGRQQGDKILCPYIARFM